MSTTNNAPEYIAPAAHLGGTSKDALLRQRMDAYSALDTALHALETMAPHARDYTPTDGRLQNAQRIHQERWNSVFRIMSAIAGEVLALTQESTSTP